MPAFTARLNMYLPGGGSMGIGGDDEVADIDRINLGLQRLDEAVGMPETVDFPEAPYPGQVVVKDGTVYRWSDELSRWKAVTPHVGTTPPTDPTEGDLWVDTN